MILAEFLHASGGLATEEKGARRHERQQSNAKDYAKWFHHEPNRGAAPTLPARAWQRKRGERATHENLEILRAAIGGHRWREPWSVCADAG